MKTRLPLPATAIVRTVSSDRDRRATEAFVPGIDTVAELRPGMEAVTVLGRFPVAEIAYRGTDIEGAPFVGFYVITGPTGGRMSGNYKAGELVLTIGICGCFNSADALALNRDMVAKGA